MGLRYPADTLEHLQHTKTSQPVCGTLPLFLRILQSLITMGLCVCHLKAEGFWSCTWAWAVRLVTGHGKGGGVWPQVSLFRCCNRKLEYYCLFGVCSNQIRIETERVWKTRGTGNYPEEERHINLWGFLHLVSSLCTVYPRFPKQ